MNLKKILSALVIFFVLTLGLTISTNQVLSNGTKEIHVKPETLPNDGHDCDPGEWHFIINQITNCNENAPASIHVVWENGNVADVPKDGLCSDGLAHYTTAENLGSKVADAYTQIYESWSGQFNLSHGPCPTAVTLASFEAHPEGKAIKVTWETATEIFNVGFNLYRSNCSTCPKVKLNTNLIPSKSPGGIMGASYEYTDSSVKPGRIYYYWLEDVELGGTTSQHGPVWSALPAQNAWQCCQLWKTYGWRAKIFCSRPWWCQ